MSILDLRARLIHPHDVIGFGVRQRLQQHGIDHAEHRRIHTNTHGEHQHRQEREAGILPQPPQTKDKVLNHLL